MAVRKLRFEGDAILRKKCREVVKVDDRIRQILDDMMDTLHELGNGAALAACQVGILKRLVVIDYMGRTMKLVNPRIVASEGSQTCLEGCLSIPERTARTLRPQKVEVEALDECGNLLHITGEDEMAKCLCHELDHLDGILFLDREVPDQETTAE